MTYTRENTNLYLKLLGYTESDTVFFRGFDEGDEARKTSCSVSKINYKTLRRWNTQGFGVFIVVNGGGHTDAEVEYCRAIFYEHDDRPKDEQKQLWQKLKLPEPTFQIDTGGKSIHSYWVFSKLSLVEDWKTLQADLLEFSNGDRSIKNPSRVMRLPGFKHQETGNQSEIISQSGKRYSYEELRQVVPTQQTQTLNFSQPAVTHLDAVPLENCLSKDDRVLVENGEGEGKRNTSGAKLARNLIGTAKRLDHLGHLYKGDPYELFSTYCSRCTPPIGNKEAQKIWKSAEESNPTATLTDDALENCIKAWHRNAKQTNTSPQYQHGATAAQPRTIGKSNVVLLPDDIGNNEPLVKYKPKHIKWDKSSHSWKIGAGSPAANVRFLREELKIHERLRLNLLTMEYEIDGIPVSEMYPNGVGYDLPILIDRYFHVYYTGALDRFYPLIAEVATKFNPVVDYLKNLSLVSSDFIDEFITKSLRVTKPIQVLM
ncbi:MAG: hypothetical protein F6K24_03120, partial [Okeania sp. SIO2D1]|nr:hypothetical protein [Okeania sp. SIO2D1]